MACERNLKTWSRFQMFDYEKELQESQNENRKGFAIPKPRTIFKGGKKLW